MSALDVLEGVMELAGLDAPTIDVSSSDESITLIMEMMTEAGKDLAARGSWRDLYKDVGFAAFASEGTIPSDFYKIGNGGSIRLNEASDYTPVEIVSSPALWQMLTGRPSAKQYCYFEDGKVKFSPTLGAEGVTMKYQSTSWVNGNTDEISANGDQFVFPDELLKKGTIWRYYRRKGMPYEDELNEFEADFLTYVNADRGFE
jgi:hypothetical protein